MAKTQVVPLTPATLIESAGCRTIQLFSARVFYDLKQIKDFLSLSYLEGKARNRTLTVLGARAVPPEESSVDCFRGFEGHMIEQFFSFGSSFQNEAENLPVYSGNRGHHVVRANLVFYKMFPNLPCEHGRVPVLIFGNCFDHF